MIGCGRVGSTVARQLLSEGWEVTAVDEKEDALARLGEGWPGGFVVGHGLDVDVLRKAPCEVMVVAYPQGVLEEEPVG